MYMYIMPAFGDDAMTKVLPFIFLFFSIVKCLGIHNHLYL